MRYKFRYVSKEGALELEWEELIRETKTYKEILVSRERYKMSKKERELIKTLSDNEAHNIRVIASRIYGEVNDLSISKAKLLIEMINKNMNKILNKDNDWTERGYRALKVIQNVERKRI